MKTDIRYTQFDFPVQYDPTTSREEDLLATTLQSDTMKSYKNIVKQAPDTLRIFLKRKGCVEESFAPVMADEQDEYEYIAHSQTDKDIILVLSGKESEAELYYLLNKFKERLHTLIYAGNHTPKMPTDYFMCVIKTTSFKHSVNESYRIAENGQTILFPRTDYHFDFFDHVYLS